MPSKTNQIKPKKIRWDIAAAITLIYKHLKDSKFALPKDKKTIMALNRLKEYFGGTDDIQTYIVVFAIWNHFDGNRFFTFRELAEYVDVTVFKISVLNPKLEQLHDKLHLMDYSKKDSVLRIKEDVINAIMNNTELEKKASPVIDYSSFVEHIYFKFKMRGELDILLEDFLDDLKEFEGMHKTIPFINRCRYRIKDDKTRFFYYDVCADKILDDETCLQSTINALYEGSERISVARQFMEEKHFLIKNGFLEFSTKGSITDAMLSLTQKGLELFLAEDAPLYEKKDEEKMIKPESIQKKELFHSLEVQSQLENLTTFLSQTHFQKIQKRLCKKGQCSGVAAILYGESGCGKTESVLQLAKVTGRSILKIDISSVRSCWYGDTEKNIKKIFTSYRTACSRMPVTPILFFNEADAIFSVRRDASLNNTHQIDNTIQNILLEEMENFSGILIATTNLIRNLDSAFSRRFLFKISFDKPSFEAKKSIWLNKLPWLSQKNAAVLAEYNLSGGDIDNIDRLIEMHTLTYGHRPNFKEIDELCRNAKINEEKETRIGFTND